MNKVTLIAGVVAFLLIAGAFLASAYFLEEGNDKAGASEDAVQLPNEECNTGTCNQQCGGNCGIPTCGCSR